MKEMLIISSKQRAQPVVYRAALFVCLHSPSVLRRWNLGIHIIWYNRDSSQMRFRKTHLFQLLTSDNFIVVSSLEHGFKIFNWHLIN
jgi:hypothetical protein